MATVRVLPGVNHTREGIIHVNLPLWARLRVYEQLIAKTISGRKVTVEGPPLMRYEEIPARSTLRR